MDHKDLETPIKLAKLDSSILHKMIQVAQAKRDFELKKATYDTEVRPLFFSTVHGKQNYIIPT